MVLLLCGYAAQGQTYTFKCLTDPSTKDIRPDSCEGCAVWLIQSRSFDGLLIYKDSVPFRWIEIPYTLKVRSDTVDIWEHTSPPSYQGRNKFFPDRVSIRLSETNFATMQDFLDSTFCNALRLYQQDSTALFYASDSISHAPVFRGDTLTIVGRDLAHVTFDSLLQKYVIQVDSVSSGSGGTVLSVAATAPAAGFTISGSPITTSGTFVFTLANDLAALEALTGTGIAVRTGTSTWTNRTITAGTGISVANGDGVAANPTITNTAPDQTVSITGAGISVVTGTYPAFTVTSTEVDGSITNEIQRLDTFAIVSNILRASLLNDGVPFSSVDLSPYVNVGTDLTFTGASSPYTLNSSTGADVTITQGSGITITRSTNDLSFAAVDPSTTNEIQTYSHAGTTTYTNTLSLGGGTWSITGAGIAAISQTAGAITVTATEAQTANNGLSDNEAGGGVFRLGNRYMNLSDGLFSNDRKVNLNAFRLFIGDNTDSTLLHIDGTNDKVGVHTTSPGRTFSVNGEVEIKDLTTTNPANLVGVDANGVLSEVFLGTNLSFTGTTLNVTGGTGTVTSVSSGNFSPLFTVSVATATTTPAFSFTATNGTAKSVFGVTGNAAAARADIATTVADQVLRNNGANNAIGWGQIATGGITDDAVTYAKIQNVVANNVVLGNIAGAGGIVAELTQANLYTLLGLTGVANRFALWTGTNTLASDAAFTFDGANDRMTVTGTIAGSGANSGFLNLNSGAITGATEFLRMSGNITGNMVASLLNSNNLANSNSILTVSTGGSVAGDPLAQFTISGVVTNTLGTDNSDGDKFKVTTNSSTPGGNANASFVMTTAAVPLYGFNIDAPVYVVDIAGQARATQFKNTTAAPTVDTPGAGLGTGGTIDVVEGGNNGFSIQFTTGTTPTADGNLFKITYSTAYTTSSFPVWCSGNDNATVEFTKFSRTTQGPAGFTQKAKGTLTAGTTYKLFYNVFGL